MNAPDLILHNARIHTLEPVNRSVAALAVSGATIAAVGDSADILQSRGPLAPGMAADFAVLDDDPLACDLMRIRDIAVLRTYVAGRAVHGPMP